jgi:formylglycine-generating enzyme required for sulfatase activity
MRGNSRYTPILGLLAGVLLTGVNPIPARADGQDPPIQHEPDEATVAEPEGRIPGTGDLGQVESWLKEADSARRRGDLTEPPERNSRYFLDRVLAVDPDNEQAREGMCLVQRELIARAMAAARDFDFELASEWLDVAAAVPASRDPVRQARERVAGIRADQARGIEERILDAILKRDWDRAEIVLIDLIALGGYGDRVAALRERLAEARRYGEYVPGDLIIDPVPGVDASAPPMVVIAAGSFLMGSPEGEKGRQENEGPRHRVTITRGFALGQREVTVAEFRRFIEATGYHTQAELSGQSNIYDEQSGRLMDRDDVNWRHDFNGRRAQGELPVLHVNWYDAQAYAQWLSERTGHPYRLPTEAEFEYAIRAGSVTAYWWGDGNPKAVIENMTGDGDRSDSGRAWNIGFESYNDHYWGPAPAGSFAANPFGLYDLAGNVSEWVADCWHETYARAPIDGSAWVNPGCGRRVVRGGYWASAPRAARSASRLSAAADVHGSVVGFRVARDL